MLSRSGGTAGSNIQRTRSATSVKERRKHPLQAEPINPQTARTHALIAAHRAVDRSRASTSTGLRRSKSAVSKRSSSSHQDRSIDFSPGTYLRRQRSTLQSQVPRLADTLHVPGRGSESPVHKDFDYEAYFSIQGENYSAEPSSYRKLQRSRSSVSPRNRVRQFCKQSPDRFSSQAPTLRTSRSSISLNPTQLKVRLKRSLDFLRRPHIIVERSITAPVCLSPVPSPRPEAVALARSQYLKQDGLPNSCGQLATSPSSRASRTQRSFRKTFRAKPLQDDGDASPCKQDQDKVRLKSEKRSISVSLSDKVKKMFGKSKSDMPLPLQQVEATKVHFSANPATKSHDAGFDSYLESEIPPVDCISLYGPLNPHLDACDDLAQLPQLTDQTNSRESLSSNSRSRVTSWTNSTTTESTATRSGTCEPKRLSIIKEDGGPHQPSSSVGRHIGGVSAFQQPLRIPEGQTIDSQRIYSALIKRIDEEQDEMKNTQAALREIHNAREQDNVVGHYLFSSPTIRRVDSTESMLSSDTRASEHRPAHYRRSESKMRNQNTSASGPCRHVDARERTTEQQTHFPSGSLSVPTETEAVNSSFARPPVDECKADATHCARQESDVDVYGAVTNQDHANRCLSNSRFMQSNESVYSRTTNGGTNADYISPLASTECFDAPPSGENNKGNMMRPSNVEASASQHPYARFDRIIRSTTAQRGSWKSWMEHQMQSLEGKTPGAKPTFHVREHAQIDPDETEVRNLSSQHIGTQIRSVVVSQLGPSTAMSPEPSSDSDALANTALGSGSSSAPLLRLREVSHNHTPTPTRNANMRRSQSALINQANANNEIQQHNRASVLSKVSSGNVARMLKVRKSQPALTRHFHPGKENSPVNSDNPPPISTPGRYQLQMRNGNSTGRLRKGKSTGCLPSERGCDNGQESPSERSKTMLSARLSRPFDMDIPDRNRPFDSTYLGKRAVGNGNRLSVATDDKSVSRPKTYGNLGPPPFQSTEGNSSTTALPPIPGGADVQRSASGLSFGLATKRLVSGFLKGRAKQQVDAATSSSRNGSPAFI